MAIVTALCLGLLISIPHWRSSNSPSLLLSKSVVPNDTTSTYHHFSHYHGTSRRLLAVANPSVSLWAMSALSLTPSLEPNRELRHSAASLPSSPPPAGCESTVIIMRHCEKADVHEHCSYSGFERAAYIATLFQPAGRDSGITAKHAKYPTPSYIYATSPGPRGLVGRKMNFRELETASPLALQSKVVIDDTFEDNPTDVAKLSQLILSRIKGTSSSTTDSNMCGKVQVVVWKHSAIGKMARYLGCGHAQGCPVDYKGKSFDDLWILRFVNHPFSQVEHSNTNHLRRHDRHHGRDTRETGPDWRVSGYVTQQRFDPLQFSHAMGDYKVDGERDGQPHEERHEQDNPDVIVPHWQPLIVNFPERKHKWDTRSWRKEIPSNLVLSQQKK
jgi:hypothetical protein